VRRWWLVLLAGVGVGLLLLTTNSVPAFVTLRPAQQGVQLASFRTEDTWNLSRLYTSEEAWKRDVKRIGQEIPKLGTYKGKLDKPEQLYALLAHEEEVMKALEKVYVYAQLQFDTNTIDSRAQRRLHEARQLAQKLSLTTSFVGPEVMALDEKKLKHMYRQEERLAKYGRYINELRKEKAHILSEKEEWMLTLTGEAMRAAGQAYRHLLDSDLVFPSIKDKNGKTITLTRQNYVSFLTSPDRQVRKRAFEAVYGTYHQYRNTFASLLQGEVKKHVIYAQARKYPSARYAALHASYIPEDVYDNLIQTVHRRIHLLHRYAALRKKALGLPTLHKYDLYMPLIPGKKREYSLDEAKAMVHKGLAVLGSEYERKLKEAFANRWMDVYSRKGKISGAYQTAVYGYPPYVLLNYHGKLDDVLTMAHELGHAMHSYYANQTQNYLTAGYDIFVAEVASTVNESLLLRQWIQQADDKKEKARLLNRYLDTFQGTLFTQTMLAEFERDIHRDAERGEALTAENLSDKYRKLVEKYYGPAVTVDSLVGVEWARIPHFYRDFYVYQYATGFSAATALADRLLTGEGEKREQYITFLKAGGSQPPLDVLKQAGVDLRDPEVVSRALDVFEQSLNELERLMEESKR
jgi:oligoendopeptidase F